MVTAIDWLIDWFIDWLLFNDMPLFYQVVSDKHERSTENLVHSKDVSETVDEENDTIMVKKKKKKKDKKKGNCHDLEIVLTSWYW